MKILLIGEFSALHRNLKSGLESIGHECLIASSGDGWKSIDRDIDFGSRRSGVFGALERRLKMAFSLYNLRGYDVVQFVSPFCLFNVPFLTKIIFRRLKKNNGKVFLLAAGTDSYYLKNAERLMEYSPLPEYFEHDLKSASHPYSSRRNTVLNRWVVGVVNGVIPIMYDYSVCYSECSRLRPIIPIPMDTSNIASPGRREGSRVTVFHGLTRFGFKGTRYVEAAFDILRKKYENIDFVVAGKLPLSEYLELMNKTDIVVDQVCSYSSGMNAIYALAMGKVVVGGNEKIARLHSDIENPVINIRPDVKSVCSGIEEAISRLSSGQNYSSDSRCYVESVHSAEKVAKQYVEEWSK